MITFQYVSDTHLEHDGAGAMKLEPIGDILLLAGDIGDPASWAYNEFMQQQSLHFEKVYVISGNHEYYGSKYDSMHVVEAQCHEVCRSMPRHNVTFLQNEAVCDVCPGVNLFGTTLWTHVPEKKMPIVQGSISDYGGIDGLTVEWTNKLHSDSVEALKSGLDSAPGAWIVMSHHIPKMSLIDARYKHCGAVNYGFASDNEIADDDRIVAWVYGHTHIPAQVGKFYCNPVGYPGEYGARSINKTFSLFINS